jgi:hypothetical protein
VDGCGACQKWLMEKILHKSPVFGFSPKITTVKKMIYERKGKKQTKLMSKEEGKKSVLNCLIKV